MWVPCDKVATIAIQPIKCLTLKVIIQLKQMQFYLIFFNEILNLTFHGKCLPSKDSHQMPNLIFSVNKDNNNNNNNNNNRKTSITSLLSTSRVI